VAKAIAAATGSLPVAASEACAELERVVWAAGPQSWGRVMKGMAAMAAAVVEKVEAATFGKAWRVIGDEMFLEERYLEVRPGVYHSALLVQRQCNDSPTVSVNVSGKWRPIPTWRIPGLLFGKMIRNLH